MTVLFAFKTKVAEDNGQRWIIREPMLWFFSSEDFFNTNVLLRESGSYFYTNLSSPYLFEDNTVKYIDYDLDVKMYPNKKTRVVDKEEYERHKIEFNYPDKLIKRIDKTIKGVLRDIRNKDGIFNYDIINSYVQQLKDQKMLKSNLKINKDKKAY
ncbi:DUF402 domain-containing protein [Mycoplasma marinum]|uniref:Rnase g and e associated domain containing protein n=1 Tax=Mycoplasma marinum TaxID=1937190 RepID=A0A4R0XT79_9MOLU|nr:DUF402 domain-containing protein [Mycoplasma marinum]TCG10829.1 rnase g and e associated domain containing protein [Mycoplasma marinum]